MKRVLDFIFQRGDRRVYKIGRIKCPFCNKNSCVVLLPSGSLAKLLAWKTYHCLDTNRKFKVWGFISRHGFCFEEKVRINYD